VYSAVPFLIAVVVTAFLAALALTLVPSYRAGMTRRFSASVGLTLPAALEPAVTARLANRIRGAAIGGAVFAVAALLLVEAGIPVGSDSDFSSFVIVGGAFVGTALGTGVASMSGGLKRSDDRVRVARAQAVDVPDYVAPLELAGARIAVALAAVGAVVAVVSAASPGLIALAAGLAAAAVVALVVFELVSRRIVRRPQPVGTPVELAWDDALRASLLRDIITAPLALGAYALFLGGIALSAALAASIGGVPGTVVQVAIIGILLLAAVALVVVAIASSPQRHFLRRLWPNLGPRPQATATDAA